MPDFRVASKRDETLRKTFQILVGGTTDFRPPGAPRGWQANAAYFWEDFAASFRVNRNAHNSRKPEEFVGLQWALEALLQEDKKRKKGEKRLSEDEKELLRGPLMKMVKRGIECVYPVDCAQPPEAIHNNPELLINFYREDLYKQATKNQGMFSETAKVFLELDGQVYLLAVGENMDPPSAEDEAEFADWLNLHKDVGTWDPLMERSEKQSFRTPSNDPFKGHELKW